MKKTVQKLTTRQTTKIYNCKMAHLVFANTQPKVEKPIEPFLLTL